MKTMMKKKVFSAKAPSVRIVFHQAGSAPSTVPSASASMLSPCQIGMSHPPRKRVDISMETVSTCEYSAMKNIENFIDEYSVWYPVTSSLSASGRSKGRRLVSAKEEIQKKKKEMASGSANIRCIRCCPHTTSLSETFPTTKKTPRRLIPRAISYEIICAPARRPPRRAYLLRSEEHTSELQSR